MTGMRFKNFVFCLLFSLGIVKANAQFTEARIGVNGLTCSQCTRSVEMQLRKLPFVSQVKMDLEHTSGLIYFKENSKVSMEALAKAVKDAGFSLRYLYAVMNTAGINISDKDPCFRYRNDTYYQLHPIPVKGATVTLQFIGNNYTSRKERNRYPIPVKVPCKGNTIYYVVGAEP